MKSIYFGAMLLLFSSFLNVQAQKTSGKEGNSMHQNGWIINLSVVTTVFFGDVKQNPILPILSNENELLYGAGLSLERVLSPSFSVRGQLFLSQLSGTHRDTDVYFITEMLEGNLAVLYFPINSIFGYNPNRYANLYIIAGVGLNNFNSTLYQLSTKTELRKSGFGNGSGIDGATLEGNAIGGIGLDFLLSSKWQIRIETSMHAVNSDWFDMTEAGFQYDMYNVTSIGIQFKFGKSGKKKSKIPVSGKTPPKELNDWTQISEVIVVEKLIDTVSQPTMEILIDTTFYPNEKIEEVIQPLVKEEVKPDIEYRVQIFAAGKNPIDKKILANRFKLDVDEIMEDNNRGMFIYSVGSYLTYQEASSNKSKMKSEDGVNDAFVVAFKNGKRLAKLPL